MLKSGSKLKNSCSFLVSSCEETLDLGRRLGQQAQPNNIYCFFGTLGSGKTTLIKGIAEGGIGIDPNVVNSPTFPLLNVYQGSSQKKLYHFDLYRLRNTSEFLNLGFEEYLFSNEICCIEWSERIEQILNNLSVIKISLQIQENGCRLITMDSYD